MIDLTSPPGRQPLLAYDVVRDVLDRQADEIRAAGLVPAIERTCELQRGDDVDALYDALADVVLEAGAAMARLRLGTDIVERRPHPAPPRPLTGEQARRLYDTDVAVEKAYAHAGELKDKLTGLQDRYFERLPLATKRADRAKGVRLAIAGGVSVRATPYEGAASFSLTRYLDAGGEMTEALRAGLGERPQLVRWTIKLAAGRKKAGAVEPA